MHARRAAEGVGSISSRCSGMSPRSPPFSFGENAGASPNSGSMPSPLEGATTNKVHASSRSFINLQENQFSFSVAKMGVPLITNI